MTTIEETWKHHITALQTEYSLWTRDPEEGIFDTVRELGIGFVAYSPLGRGFLTGRFKRIEDFEGDDYRRLSPRFRKENFEKNYHLVEKIDEVARRKSVTSAQLALAWVLAQGEDIVPIPGTKHIKYLQENSTAVDIKFTKNELENIDKVFRKDAAAGTRYPEQMMKFVNA